MHFPKRWLSYPPLTLTCLAFDRIFFRYVPAFSHVFALLSSAYHHISFIFTVFSTISIKHVLFPPFDAIFLHFPLHFPMFFLSFPLPTTTFPAFSQYVFSRCFPAFPKFLLSFPLLTPTFLAFAPYFFRYIPACSHVFALLSSAYHHISFIFILFPTVSIKHVLFPPFDAIFLHFPMFFLSFPLPTITFPAFSQYVFSRCFPAFPKFLLSFPLLTPTFLAFAPYFFRYVPAFSHVFALLSSAYHHISFIFTVFSTISIKHLPFPPFDAIFLHFPYLSSRFPSIPSHFLRIRNLFYDFHDVILQYSATKIADLGGSIPHGQPIA